MTTVVIHDNKVYCDSQATAGNMITDYDAEKALNLGQCIVVGAGRWSHVVKFQNWVADNVMAEIAQQEHPYANVQMPEEMVEEDFQGAILYPDGLVIMFEGARDSFECSQPVFLGSGGSFAAGAIAAGADGVTAIEAAILLDPYSGGDVKVEGFEEQPNPITKETLEGLTKDEILSKLFPDECATLESEPSQEDFLVVKGNDYDYGVYYQVVDGDVVLDDLVFEGQVLPLTLSCAEECYPVLKAVAADLNVSKSHNIKPENLMKKLIDHLEQLVKKSL